MGLFKRRAPTSASDASPRRLHIGCGQQSIAGWINIDNKRLPGVDQVLDVRRGLRFQDVSSIFAEHFLEHLTLDEGLGFLRECRRILTPEGVLRLSTPNLDWVMLTQYHGPSLPEAEARLECMHLNRAFHGWGHQFLYNRHMLSAVLQSAGFERIVPCRYRESALPELAGLERHETWKDTPELPHVLIMEASGAASATAVQEAQLRELREAFVTR